MQTDVLQVFSCYSLPLNAHLGQTRKKKPLNMLANQALFFISRDTALFRVCLVIFKIHLSESLYDPQATMPWFSRFARLFAWKCSHYKLLLVCSTAPGENTWRILQRKRSISVFHDTCLIHCAAHGGFISVIYTVAGLFLAQSWSAAH